MATPDLNGGARVIAVRLTDVPIQIRRRRGKALYEAAVADRDLDLALRLNAAIERPSDRVYWLPERKVREVLG
jgi:hypothetical protein